VCVVPSVTGLSVGAAQAALTAAHCALGSVSTAFSSTVPAGRIASQSVSPGTSLANGATVNVVVSRGKKKAPPKLVTLCNHGHTVRVTKAKAKTLRKHGAKLGACKKKR
jgi:beta-lactam-binding protein with PASTA domain